MDLDRTLFNTNDFVRDIWQLAARMYNVNDKEQLARTSSFRTYYGDMYDYDFYAHLALVAEGRLGMDAFNAAAREQLSGRYLYPDVTEELITATAAIITFGNERYQKLKLSLCPELAALQCHFVLQPKGLFISQEYGASPVILVDDKCPQSLLPSTVRFIHLDRGELVPKHRCEGESLTRLSELLPMLGAR